MTLRTEGTFGLDERLARAWRKLRGGALTPGRAALSVAVGLFVCAFPIYGFQLAAVVAICLPLGLDAAVAYLAAHVANPFTAPALLALEAEVGSFLLTGHATGFELGGGARRALVGEIGLGAPAVATGLAAVGGAIAFFVARGFENDAASALRDARRRVIARYRETPRNVRGYVAGKLLGDAALERLATLGGHFGRVVDAGSGYGQLALGLVELGRVTSLSGFDRDRERIRAAKAAARQSGTFEVSDLVDVAFPEADTILFIDSLHYLDESAQDRVLERAAAALAPRGRIVLRDVNAGGSFRSRWTELLERAAIYLRGGTVPLHFRSAASFVRALERHGLTCTVLEDDVTFLQNAMIVAQRRTA